MNLSLHYALRSQKDFHIFWGGFLPYLWYVIWIASKMKHFEYVIKYNLVPYKRMYQNGKNKVFLITNNFRVILKIDWILKEVHKMFIDVSKS